MRANAILRAALLSSAALCLTLSASALVFAQDVGADVGGGAGIFRAKNPETKKGANKPGTAKPTGKSTCKQPRKSVGSCGANRRPARQRQRRLATRESLLKPKKLTKKF